MSDAYSDMARLEREDQLYGDFLEQVYKYLGKKSLPKDDKMIKLVNSLKLKEKKTWIKVLNDCKDLSKWELFKKFKEHSENPLKGKVILDIDYGYGFMNMGGNIIEDIASLLGDNGMAVFDGDKYSILIDENILKNSEIVWRGHNSAKTPYRRDRK